MTPLARWVGIIGGITLVSGLVQAAAPTLILGPLHADVSATSAHFFRIVGMFMALFGGLLLHSCRGAASAAFVPLLWSGLQKVGAVAGVVAAVALHLLSPVALGVALFDLASAAIILVYARAARRGVS